MAFGRLGSLGTGFGRLGAGRHVGTAAAAGGAVLLVGETDGFATDFTSATDASRVAVKAANVATSYGLDAFFASTGTSPKTVFDVTGALVWSPHNMFLNSAAPVTQNVTTVVGQNYTVTVTGSGSMTGSAGASGVATAGSPLTYTATTTTSTFTKAGTVTQIQMNRGPVATAYIATTGAIKNGLAVDYHPSTHAALGLLVEKAATNLLLNSVTLSTQNVTVSAVAYTLSFFGTGTVTLTGVSTAGPLTGTGAANRVSLTFTPTAGSLTLTVSGTVSYAQLETGPVPTSVIPTYGATVTRAADAYQFLVANIPAWTTEFSMYCRFTPFISNNNHWPICLTNGPGNDYAGFQTTVGSTLNFATTDAGGSPSSIVGPAVTAGTFYSAAGRVKLNDVNMSVNGAAVGTADIGVTVPTPLVSGVFASDTSTAVSPSSFRIQKLMIVPRGWSNAELVTQSAVT